VTGTKGHHPDSQKKGRRSYSLAKKHLEKEKNRPLKKKLVIEEKHQELKIARFVGAVEDIVIGVPGKN